ncbi:MAG: hypothetical protein M1826_000621 [Phylliscum demangeonii]|nr:MAG: hypothetical protein M1826_000621 [Phylliscum demangeonii]
MAVAAPTFFGMADPSGHRPVEDAYEYVYYAGLDSPPPGVPASAPPSVPGSALDVHRRARELDPAPWQAVDPSAVGLTSAESAASLLFTSYASHAAYDDPLARDLPRPVRYLPSQAPSPSASHPRRRTESSNVVRTRGAGASVASTTSSAIGSPASATSRSVARPDLWMPHEGLGISSAIAATESVAYDPLVTGSLSWDPTYADDKTPTAFVGEYRALSSSVDAASVMRASAPPSSPLVPASFPLATASRRPPGSPLEAARHDLHSHLRMHAVPGLPAAPSWTVSPVDHFAAEDGSGFRSPTSPALPRSTRAHRATDDAAPRWNPYPPPLPRQASPRTASRPHPPRPAHHSPAAPAAPPSPGPPLASPLERDPLQQSPFFMQSSGHFVAPLQSSYPSLLQSFHTPGGYPVNAVPTLAEVPDLQSPRLSPHYSPSAAPPPPPARNVPRPSSALHPTRSPSPYPPTRYQPYGPRSNPRRPSATSPPFSQFVSGTVGQSPRPASRDSNDEDDGRQKDRCPHPDCGRVYKDLKAHMLTHQPERPEKCPIVTCEYHHKGFARKYDKNRHTLTHYKGTMVCSFCPGSGSVAEKSFNRADVFKRHLMAVHHVEQTPPNSRKRSSTGIPADPSASHAGDGAGRCSTCSETFGNAQDFYEHLDDCVLRVVQQEDPGEAINERHLRAMNRDAAVADTFRGHALALEPDAVPRDERGASRAASDDGPHPQGAPAHAGGGLTARPGHRSGAEAAAAAAAAATAAATAAAPGALRNPRPGMGRGRKRRRRHYPVDWGCSPDQMRVRRRVLCVFDGSTRLVKDSTMLERDYDVRVAITPGQSSYVTDLDVQTLRRADEVYQCPEEGERERERLRQRQRDPPRADDAGLDELMSFH